MSALKKQTTANKSSQQKGFIARKAFHAQSPKNCGLESFFAIFICFLLVLKMLRVLPDDPFWRRPCNAKISYALPGALGLQFFRLLPEAYLLTVPIKVSGK